MNGEFYKMDFDAWDEGTDDLTLEQEAAYLRLCHQLYRRKAAIPNSPASLARIWRCHQNKARKLISDLVEAGKVTLVDGLLSNTRVRRELDERETRRRQQADAGHIGGARSQENRRKPMKTNDADAADAEAENKQNQAEKEREREEEKKEQTQASPVSVGQDESDGFPSNAFDLFWTEYPAKVGKDAARKSFANVRKSRRVTFGNLMTGLHSYIEFKPATRDFCHPTTWLNQGRWADVHSPPPSGRAAPSGSHGRSNPYHDVARDALEQANGTGSDAFRSQLRLVG